MWFLWISVFHLANERRQIHRIKRAWNKPCAALAQHLQGLVEATTNAAGCGEMGEVEWVQGEVSYLKNEIVNKRVDNESRGVVR